MASSIDFDPAGLAFDYMPIALGVAGVLAFLIGRIKIRSIRIFAIVVLCLLPLAVFFVTRMADGCTGHIPQNEMGALGLTKAEECWGRYGFGGVYFLGLFAPLWVIAVALGLAVRRFTKLA